MTEHMPLTMVRTKPYERMRYPTVGDWQFERKIRGSDQITGLAVTVAHLPDWRYEALIGVHELVEALLCKARGISEESVTAFDNAQLQWLKEHNIDPTLAEEPGDHPDAPYRREHFFATTIERLLAAELGVDWEEYDKAVNAL